MKHRVTFIGGADTGDVARTVWGHQSGYHAAPGGAVEFELHKPVVIDVDGEPNGARKEFLAHLLKKAKTHRHFKVEEVRPGRPPSGEA